MMTELSPFIYKRPPVPKGLFGMLRLHIRLLREIVFVVFNGNIPIQLFFDKLSECFFTLLLLINH